jgi:ABC-type phosphate transport system substrate-binding protein
VANYINWTLTDAGQKIVESSGYVPLPPQARKK